MCDCDNMCDCDYIVLLRHSIEACLGVVYGLGIVSSSN